MIIGELYSLMTSSMACMLEFKRAGVYARLVLYTEDAKLYPLLRQKPL